MWRRDFWNRDDDGCLSDWLDVYRRWWFNRSLDDRLGRLSFSLLKRRLGVLDLLGRFGFCHRLGGDDWFSVLDQTRRREQRCRRLERFWRPLRHAGLLALHDRRFSKDVAAGWQRDVALLGQTIHELPSDDLFDRARRAPEFDAVIALEQRRHFLAGRAQEFRDPINPNS